ncbi:MAG: hypothetical protein L0Y39_00420 [Methylococcaceae bacterium]|nr:hypothetical protein [Methylococcaceae bacterium]
MGFYEEDLHEESAAMESFLDETIATLLRSIAYNILLKDRKILISFWGLDGPFYSKAWLTLTVPYLARLIKQMYKTDSVYIGDHKDRFNAEMDRLDRVCESKPFLVGNRFSRCDLTMAAILAPLNFPKEHPYPNPVPYPDEFQIFCGEQCQRPALKRVAEIYRDYRHSS